MSCIAIFNGYGRYEQTNEGQKGITLLFGGIPFWLPYDEVTYIPDYTMRELDHKAMTADDGEGVVQYLTFRVTGDQIAQAILDGTPYKNSDKGIIVIQNDAKKRKNSYVRVLAGREENGQAIIAEIQEIAPSEFEINDAHAKAKAYKEAEIQMYFQGKRERMMGGFGHQAFPTGLIRVYMDELGVSDLDDVVKKDSGSNDALVEALTKAFGPKPVPVPVLVGGKPAGAQSIV